MATNWIAGITVGEDGRLRPLVQSGADVQALPLAGLATDLGIPGGVRRKVSLALHELQPSSTAKYLAGLGLLHLCSDGQPAYEANCTLGTIVIPAQLLVMATLGVSRPLRHNLLSVHGPGFLGTAVPRTDHMEVLPTPHRMEQLQVEAAQILNRLEWLLTYPSAQAAWGSVYRRALNEKFDMRMPRASVEISVTGHRVDAKFLVTRLTVMKLVPRESPGEYARSAAKHEFVFNNIVHRRPTHGKAAAPTRDEDVASNRGPAALTDEEWQRIEPIVAAPYNPRRPGASRKHSLRETIDAILLKVGTPYSWSKVPVERELVSSASVLLSKLKRSCVWEQVVAAIS